MTMTLPAAAAAIATTQSYKYNSSTTTSQTDFVSFLKQQRSYVGVLVDITVQVIASIWPTAVTCSNLKPVADLHVFLSHILKHSRTTHSTLQLVLFYLFRIRANVQKRQHQDVYMACGRRMFLAALISAHKYLQDKTYKNSAWSKVSGLHVSEINHAERVFLELVDYRLYVKKDAYDQWIAMLQKHLPVPSVSPIVVEQTVNNNKKRQQQQQQQQQVLVAQQSLPSPPLEESIILTQKKRKWQDDDDDETTTLIINKKR